MKKNILSGKISQENEQNNGQIIMTNIIYQLAIFHNYEKILEGLLHDSEGENKYRGSQLTCVDALVLEPPRKMMNWGLEGSEILGHVACKFSFSLWALFVKFGNLPLCASCNLVSGGLCTKESRMVHHLWCGRCERSLGRCRS